MTDHSNTLSEAWDSLSPGEIRGRFRSGFIRPTSGLANGFAQANLLILPQDHADEFAAFCHLNPQACPLIERSAPGDVRPMSAPSADIRTDLPLYRVYRHGEVAGDVHDISSLWRKDLVSFLMGCSYTFEASLQNVGIKIRHSGGRVPMYATRLPCVPAGRFSGNVVVSMRPVPTHLISKVVEITQQFEGAHGSPLHIGDPREIGLDDLHAPDFGDPVDVFEDEVPVFWACGVTSQLAVVNARPPLAISHAPGYMFVTDLLEAGSKGHV